MNEITVSIKCSRIPIATAFTMFFTVISVPLSYFIPQVWLDRFCLWGASKLIKIEVS